MTDTFTTSIHSLNQSESSHSQTDVVKGDIMYHVNPIGNNYKYAGLKGEIIRFVNITNKRAVVRWENGVEKKHNVRSLVRNLPVHPSTVVKACKKRKYYGNQLSQKKRKKLPPVLTRVPSMIFSEHLRGDDILLPDTFVDKPLSSNDDDDLLDDMLDDMFDGMFNELTSSTIVEENDYNKLLGPTVYTMGITV